MNKYNHPEILPNSKAIIALGDSFTQGVGGWSKSTYKRHKNKIDYNKINNKEFNEMYKNSWVNQLTNMLEDYLPINLGRLGIGNRAASSEIFLNPDINFKNISQGYVIFMLSGLERFDFVNKDFSSTHFFAVWPQEPHPGVRTPDTWRAYEKEIWSEKSSVIETLLSIKNVESFAEANNLKLILISAFDQRYTRSRVDEILGNDKKLADIIPWDRFVYPQGMPSCINLLVDLEGKPQDLAYGDFWPHYNSLKEPSKYISNCAHPTEEGYAVIADELYKFIKEDRL